MNRFRIWYAAQPRALRTLLAINVVLYVAWQIIFIHFTTTREIVWFHLALNPGFPGILYEPWQIVTYSFLHLQTGLGGFLHILFNMLWMMWIGREYEVTHGSHRIFSMYIFGGIGGGVLTVLLHAFFPSVDVFGGPVHGASAAVLGIMTAIGVQFPQRRIGLMFIGVVRLIHIVIGFLVLDLLFLAGGGTSVSAHLGGVLAGFLFARASLADIDLSAWARPLFRERRVTRLSLLHRWENWFESRQSRWRGNAKTKTGSSKTSRREKTLFKVRGGARGRGDSISESGESRRIQNTEPTSGGDSDSEIQREIDRILDKITETG